MTYQPIGTEAPARVLLVEPNPLVVSALVPLFERSERFALVHSTDKGSDLLAADENDFDLVVLGWQLSDMAAAEVLKELKHRQSGLRVTIFSNNKDIGVLRLAIRLGALGYCYQYDDPDILFETLRAVANGRICVPYIDVSHINDTPLAQLTVRERELLEVLARGWTNQQIANRTGISENTVKYHLKNLYEKLGVRNRAMAVALYSRESED